MDKKVFDQIVRWVLLLAIFILLVVFSIIGHRNYKEYAQFRERDILLQERVTAERTEFERQQKYYNRLMNDPFFLEAVVRDRLGYVRQNELVFRFEDGVFDNEPEDLLTR